MLNLHAEVSLGRYEFMGFENYMNVYVIKTIKNTKTKAL